MSIVKFSGQHRWLSNFHEADIDYLGLTFRTTEAAYQAAKRNDDIAFHLTIQRMTWAGEAMHYGRSLPILTPGWHQRTKFEVMFDINLQKFTRYPDLKSRLLATGQEHLEEGNTWGDTIWGTCEGVGENRLGKILMDVRFRIREIDRIRAELSVPA